MCCRCSPFLLAVAAGVVTAVALQDHISIIGSTLHDALADAALPPDTRDTIIVAALKVLPVAVPLTVFAFVYAMLGIIGQLSICIRDPCVTSAPLEAHYVRMPPQPQRGAWLDGLFSCLNDVPICLVACCLPPVIVGQLYERATGRRGSCVLIVFLVGGLGLFATAATSVWCSQCSVSERGGMPHVSCAGGGHPPPVCGFVNTVSAACVVAMVALVMLARAAIRREHKIAPACGCDGCGGCDDCCVSFCCLPLAAAQATRHLQAVDKASRPFPEVPRVDVQHCCQW